MARRNIYEVNYGRLVAILGCPPGEIGPDVAHRYCAESLMDLVVERLPDCPETGAVVLSLAHYFTQHGDLCQDPEMTVRIFPPGCERHRELVLSTDPRLGRAEALTFRQAIPPLYHDVYPAPGRFRPRLKRDLNTFLATWLRNLRQQGHRRVDAD